MKRVLLVDASPILEEFLTQKLRMEQVHIESSSTQRDAFSKMVTMVPDLVIVDIENSIDVLDEFLQSKLGNASTRQIPFIICGPEIPRPQIANLVQYGLIKYFQKPIKFDIFFSSIGRLLGLNLSMDETPCVLELHLKKNIIFIEIAQGLNREKISLLKYKLNKMITANRISEPKIILMMTDLNLNFVDGINLEFLIDNVIADARIDRDNFKILSLSKFVHDLVEGHPEYSGIEVVSSLNTILDHFVQTSEPSAVPEIVADLILTSDHDASTEQDSVEMRFNKDLSTIQQTDTSSIRVGIMDCHEESRNAVKAAFETIKADIQVFSTGKSLSDAMSQESHMDLFIMDIDVADMNGMELFKFVQTFNQTCPTIIYSKIMQRETVMEALGLGAKAYISKSQNADAVLTKAMELLNQKK